MAEHITSLGNLASKLAGLPCRRLFCAGFALSHKTFNNKSAAAKGVSSLN
jgi:hypothetical protein